MRKVATAIVCSVIVAGAAGLLRSRDAAAAAQEVAAPAGTWAFTPGTDPLDDSALLDLRWLNEDIAGEHGFIGLSADGNSFVRGDGEPIRFWAVNSYAWRDGPEALAEQARFLAKRGVNMVRWHGDITPKGDEAPIDGIDEQARDQLWQYVAAMKDEGIYMTLSPYYPHATPNRPGYGFDSPQDNLTCLLFFDERLQQAYKGWLRAILEPVNPYTGLALREDPALAIIQMQNEDSMLFWTVDQVGGQEKALLESLYAQWLTRRYGSLEQTLQAWDNVTREEDQPDQGRIALLNIWELTSGPIDQFGPATGGLAQRRADQAHFYTETMRQWNAEFVRFLRDEIGAPQLTNAGNWRTADEQRLLDLERYAYEPTDVMGVNRYYTGGEHAGEHQGWAIVDGDRFENESVLRNPAQFPANIKQVAGHPFIIPETLWVPPLGYQAEGPFLMGALQSVSGVDIAYWFAFGETQWRQPSSANGYLPSVGKWVGATPAILGQFPATALLFRQGYLTEAEPVLEEQRRLVQLWERQLPLLAEAPSYDPNRDEVLLTDEGSLTLDARAFLVGPALAEFGGDPADTRFVDFDPYLSPDGTTVTSATGQVVWNTADGVCAIDAPAAQGVCGFLAGAGPFELSDVTIECANEYAAILLVSLDGAPLAESGRVLLQIGTVARPTGWETRPATWGPEDARKSGLEVVDYGEAPWQVVSAAGRIRVQNPGLTSMTMLDPNGYPVGQAILAGDGEGVNFDLPPGVLYAVLE